MLFRPRLPEVFGEQGSRVREVVDARTQRQKTLHRLDLLLLYERFSRSLAVSYIMRQFYYVSL